MHEHRPWIPPFDVGDLTQRKHVERRRRKKRRAEAAVERAKACPVCGRRHWSEGKGPLAGSAKARGGTRNDGPGRLPESQQ